MSNKNSKQQQNDPVDDYFYTAGVIIFVVLMIWGLT